MRKLFTIFLVLIFVLGLIPVNFLSAADLSTRLKGKILLQVEDKGQAWYVEPKTGERHYMADGNSAYSIMRNLGIGITNKNLDRIKSDKNFAKKYSGKIFLQIESRGEAFYIDTNGDAHYLKDGAAAYSVMRNLGLGITNNDLEKVPTFKKSGDEALVVPNSETNQVVSDTKKDNLTTVVDVCKNLEGIQADMPVGMIINSNNNCVVAPQVNNQVNNNPVQTTCQLSFSHEAGLEDTIDPTVDSNNKTFFAFQIDSNEAVKLNSIKISQEGIFNHFAGFKLYEQSGAFSMGKIERKNEEQTGYISFGELNISLKQGKNVFKLAGNIQRESAELNHIFKINSSSQIDLSRNCSFAGLPVETKMSKIQPEINLSVTRSSDSQSDYFNPNYCWNVQLNQPSASFDFSATGYEIRVQQLAVVLYRSNKTYPIDSDNYFTFNMDGTQIGISKKTKDGDENTLWGDGVIFSFGSQIIIPKGQTKKISVFAHVNDITTQDGDAFKIVLLKGNNNAEEMYSYNIINTDGAVGNLVVAKKIPCQ